ncbi:response regulator transcription factor [uncultured Clostridium sp.]|uniref:response regulator transcription factor n=1 Tax=uncultured Clostridium sp. TaxID=59620 RepID=UPI0025DCAD8F|nr:response regulator transcription factor [uncultured Clostridium sp.]
MKNVLIVDDEKTITDVVEIYLINAGYNVFKAHNGKEALNTFNLEYIDLIILDLMLPDMSGEEICRTIKSKSTIPIIMLTAKVEEENILEGFSLGADDYVVKPFSVKQLVARVTAILKRTQVQTPSIMSFNNGDLIINSDNYEVKKNNEIINLTPSEFKILSILSQNRKKVFTRDELLDKVMGDDCHTFDRIIDSHIKNLRSKIESDSKKPEYIITVYGIGYKFGGKIND